MTDEEIRNLGPLAPLAGVWEGDKGKDRAPSASRGIAFSDYRERMTFEPTGRVDNHEQILYGLRYRTVAHRLTHEVAFHEELGYWLWDAANHQVMRCFLVPRGIALIAGGTVEANATQFDIAADLGSQTYGIVSNRFLDAEFQTVRFELTVTIVGRDTFHYEEDTIMRVKGQAELFHHTDANTMRRVG